MNTDQKTDSLIAIIDKITGAERFDCLSQEEHQELGAALRSKVDGCAAYLDRLADDIERHKRYAREHTEKAKSLEAGMEKFKDYIVYSMRAGDFEKLTGEEFSFSIRKSEAIEVTREADASDYAVMPEAIRWKESFSWDKTALKELAKRGSPLPVCVALVTRDSLVHKIKK